MPEWNYENAAHLLRRAAFGGTPQQTDDFYTKHESVADAVETLLKFKVSKKKLPKGGRSFYQASRKQGRKWLTTMLKAKRPGDALREKLVLFWHNHLVSGHSKQRSPEHMAVQNQLFRIYAKGNFKDLMREFNRDIANLYYLDGIENYASFDDVTANANENFGRELVELQTLNNTEFAPDGADDPLLPTYTEADVRGLARALTGWVDHDGKHGVWNPDEWDGGRYDDNGDGEPDPVTIFGIENNNFRIDQAVAGSSDDILELIFARTDSDGNNQTAMHLCLKLWTWFAYPPPVPGHKALIAGFAQTFAAGGFEVDPVLREMFNHDAFYSDAAKTRTIKSPVDFIVGTLRALGVKSNGKGIGRSGRELFDWASEMGMTLFEPPNVAGWPGGSRWITTGTLLERLDFARRVAEASDGSNLIKFKKLDGFPLGDDAVDPAVLVDAVLAQLGLDGTQGPVALGAAQRDDLIDFASDFGATATLDLSSENTGDFRRKARGVVALVLQAAESQIF